MTTKKIQIRFLFRRRRPGRSWLALGITLIFAGLVTHAVVSIVGAAVLLRVGDWLVVRRFAGAERRSRSRELRRSDRAQVPRSSSRWTTWRCRPPRPASRSKCILIGRVFTADSRAPSRWRLSQCSSVSSRKEASGTPSICWPPALFARWPKRRSSNSGSFSGAGLIAGTFIHGLISLLVGLLYAISLPMFPRGATWRSGLVTPLLWSGLVAATLGLINPTLNARIDWTWFVGSQIAFGLAASQGDRAHREDRDDAKLCRWSKERESKRRTESPRRNRGL